MRMRLVLAAGSAIGIAAVGSFIRWRRSWGVAPAEAALALPGDELVADPTGVDTRGITIDAPPELVWPWLVQMGFGRGGWYSIDQLDMRGSSAHRIVDEWQRLEVGDIVATYPGGGFEVKVLEPGRALVLYTDTALVQRQAEADRLATLEPTPPGLAVSGVMLGATPQQFAASWTFDVEPAGEGRTRLVERVRVRFEDASPGPAILVRFLGVGVFVMMQRQMVGIRARAEKLARDRATLTGAPEPSTKLADQVPVMAPSNASAGPGEPSDWSVTEPANV